LLLEPLENLCSSAGYCPTLLSEATRKLLFKRPANGRSRALGSPKAAKGAGKAATRKPLGKCPADGQSRAPAKAPGSI